MSTTDVGELKSFVENILDKNGVLSHLKSRIRAEVCKAIECEESPAKTVICKENLLINELIREYLEFNKYSYSSSVFEAECGLSKDQLDRDFIAKELNIKENQQSRSVPLILSIITHFINSKDFKG